MKTGILFAGQGSQYAGMGSDLYERFDAFRNIFDKLTDDEKRAAFEGPESELVKTDITQPVMLAFAIGVYEVLRQEVPGFEPAMAAGLSLGEYSALTAAGVFDHDTAMQIIRLRGKLMARQAEGSDAVMSAVIGLEKESLNRFVKEASSAGLVEAANYNCPEQIVISGSEEGVSLCEKLIRNHGRGKTIRLAVGGPFHTSYMEPVGEALKEKFRETDFKEMKFPVLFNYTGDKRSGDTTVQELLCHQVSGSVMFEDTIRNMIRYGVERIIEIGPGKTLSGFVKKTDRRIKTLQAGNVKELEKVIDELNGDRKQ